MDNRKPGDKARVRSDLEHAKRYGNDVFVDNMEPWLGQEVTISKTGQNTLGKYYKIKEDGGKWNWTEEMFEQEAPNESNT